MNNLINVTLNENQEPVVLGRQLHQVLNVNSNYTTWFERMTEYGFTEGEDFLPNMDGIRWWQFTNTGIAGGLDKNVVLLDDDDTIQSNDSKGEETMDFLFNIKGDPAWNEGTLYFYNGHTNQIRALAHIDEMKIIQQIYKDNNGHDIPSYTWTNNAPWYARLFRALNPDSTSAQIQEAIKVTKEQAKATTEAITKEVKAAAEATNAEVRAAKDAPQKVEVTIKNN